MTSQGAAVDLHFCAGARLQVAARLVEPQDLSRRVVEFVMIELGHKQCRVERHVDLGCERCEFEIHLGRERRCAQSNRQRQWSYSGFSSQKESSTPFALGAKSIGWVDERQATAASSPKGRIK